jgi:hypothetical protein
MNPANKREANIEEVLKVNFMGDPAFVMLRADFESETANVPGRISRATAIQLLDVILALDYFWHCSRHEFVQRESAPFIG